MKNPQVISIAGTEYNSDSVISIWYENVILDSDQSYIAEPGDTVSPLTVDVILLDLTTGSQLYSTSVTMTFMSDSGFWTIPVLSLVSNLTDRHKYVARIAETGETVRSFFLDEFAVDNNSFEESIMRLPYQIETDFESDHTAMVWYDDVANFTDHSHAKYYAYLYMNGAGTTYATDVSRVTHRGPITPYIPA